MSLQLLLAWFLSVVTGPWATGIATVLLVLAGGGLAYGEDSWSVVVTRVNAAFALLVLSANFLSALGLIP